MPVTLSLTNDQAAALEGILNDAYDELAKRNSPPRGMGIGEAYARLAVCRAVTGKIFGQIDRAARQKPDPSPYGTEYTDAPNPSLYPDPPTLEEEA